MGRVLLDVLFWWLRMYHRKLELSKFLFALRVDINLPKRFFIFDCIELYQDFAEHVAKILDLRGKTILAL